MANTETFKLAHVVTQSIEPNTIVKKMRRNQITCFYNERLLARVWTV